MDNGQWTLTFLTSQNHRHEDWRYIRIKKFCLRRRNDKPATATNKKKNLFLCEEGWLMNPIVIACVPLCISNKLGPRRHEDDDAREGCHFHKLRHWSNLPESAAVPSTGDGAHDPQAIDLLQIDWWLMGHYQPSPSAVATSQLDWLLTILALQPSQAHCPDTWYSLSWSLIQLIQSLNLWCMSIRSIRWSVKLLIDFWRCGQIVARPQLVLFLAGCCSSMCARGSSRSHHRGSQETYGYQYWYQVSAMRQPELWLTTVGTALYCYSE